MTIRALYLWLRRTVDRDISSNGKPASPFLGMFALALACVLTKDQTALVAAGVRAVASAIAVAWSCFVLWRIARLWKARAIKNDRRYDQKDKYALAAEYHETDSATRSARRRRRPIGS